MTTLAAHVIPTTDTFSPDLVAALAELRTLQQDGSNPHFKSRYMTLQTLIEGVRPILARHNLALLQPVTADGNSVTVTTVILHASGAKFDSALTLTATGPATPQALGSLISYARRYGAGSLLGIVSDPDADDDANAASAPVGPTPAETQAYDRWVRTLATAATAGLPALMTAVRDGDESHKARLRANTTLWAALKNGVPAVPAVVAE
jgi:hypothetical protein